MTDPTAASIEERVARHLAAKDWLTTPEHWDQGSTSFRADYLTHAREVIAIVREADPAAPAGPAPATDRDATLDKLDAEQKLIRDHTLALHQISEQLSEIESWFWAHLADVREAARQKLGGPLPDDVVPAMPSAPADQTALAWFTEGVVERCPDHGCVEPVWADGCHCELVPLLRRLAGTAQQDNYEATTGHAITCAAGFGMGCQCGDEAQQDPRFTTRPGDATVDPAMCPRCKGDNSEAFALCDRCAAVARPGQPTAYGDGKSRVYCLGCAHHVGADVPLTVEDVDHGEMCPSCGRHVVDVARPGRPETEARCPDAFWIREPEEPHTWWQSPTRPHRPCPGVPSQPETDEETRCVCGDPIEWMNDRRDPGWIHSPGSDTPCLNARPATPPA